MSKQKIIELKQNNLKKIYKHEDYMSFSKNINMSLTSLTTHNKMNSINSLNFGNKKSPNT